MTPLRQRVLDELQRRNYSPATTRGYILAIKQFAEYFGKSPERLGGDEIRQFELYLLKEKKLAPGTVEGRMSALRFLYRKVLKRRDIAYDDLIFPKVPRKLPVVLSPEEDDEDDRCGPEPDAPDNPDAPLRDRHTPNRGSLLKVSDIDSERMVIHIHQGKGSRDRDVPMTPKLLEALREYFRWKRPKVYLFPSTEGHRGVEQPLSDHTIWYICSEAAKRAGIKKDGRCAHAPPQFRDNSDGGRDRPADDPTSHGTRAPGTHHGLSAPVAASPACRVQPARSDHGW